MQSLRRTLSGIFCFRLTLRKNEAQEGVHTFYVLSKWVKEK